jgi:hypothetical protein
LEFERCIQKILSGTDAQLLSAKFSSVSSTERLAHWLTTKWAVLWTYNIAAIRAGARPVYANRAGDGMLEIVWQELMDYNTVTVGKMIIEVTATGLTARRASGGAQKGYGTMSRKPLNGATTLQSGLSSYREGSCFKGTLCVCCFLRRQSLTNFCTVVHEPGVQKELFA